MSIKHTRQTTCMKASDIDEDWTHKDKDRTLKDKDKDFILVLKGKDNDYITSLMKPRLQKMIRIS